MNIRKLSAVMNVVLKGRKGKRAKSKVNKDLDTFTGFCTHLSEAERTDP